MPFVLSKSILPKRLSNKFLMSFCAPSKSVPEEQPRRERNCILPEIIARSMRTGVRKRVTNIRCSRVRKAGKWKEVVAVIVLAK